VQNQRSPLLGGDNRGGGRHAVPANSNSLVINEGQALSK
jgi:hypothetical protein